MVSASPIIPRELRLVLTNKCNFACYFCFNEGYPKEFRSVDLAVVDYLMIVRQMVSEYGLKKVRISGGEPLVSPILPSLLRELRTTWPELDVGFTTNASLPHILKEILLDTDLGDVKINASVHSVDKARLQAICRTENVGGVLYSLQSLAESAAGRVKFNCVYTGGPRGDEDAMTVLALAEEFNVTVKLLCLNVNPYNQEDVLSGLAIKDVPAKPGTDAIYALARSLGYQAIPGRQNEMRKGDHCIEVVDCSISDPIAYYNNFRTIRIYFNSRVAVTGEFDGFCRSFSRLSPITAIRGLVADISAQFTRTAEQEP